MKTGEECRHPQLKITYLSNEEGSVELEICMNEKCAKIVTTTCEHKKSTWKYTRNQADPDEQYLACNLCGQDGT